MSLIVTRFSGCRLWTRRILPFFFGTQNQLDRYEEFDGSYTPEAILSLMYCMTSPRIPGGTGILLAILHARGNLVP